jgi:hypothetical protein
MGRSAGKVLVMSVSLLMGWGLLALLVLLVVLLVVVTLISGRSGSPAKGGRSPGEEVPVNVFQRGVPAHRPASRPAPYLSGAEGRRRWYPGIGSARAPRDEG